jgi:hypothetical protein
MEQKLEFDVAQYAVAHEQMSNTAHAIKFDNRAFAVTALGFSTVLANPPTPISEPVAMQPVPEAFAADYRDALS